MPTWVGAVCLLVVVALIGVGLVAARGAGSSAKGLTPGTTAHERELVARYRDRAVAKQVIAPVSPTDPDGDVVIVAYKGHDLHPALVRLHPVGGRATQVWSRDLERLPGIDSGYRIHISDGTIYLERAGMLFAYSVAGTPLWTARAVSSCDCEPVAGRLLAISGSTLVAYGPASADPAWTSPLPSQNVRVTTVGDRLLLSYVTSRPRRSALAAVDPRTGRIRWTTLLPCGSGPTVPDDPGQNEGAVVARVPGTSEVVAAWKGVSRCAARVDLERGTVRWSTSYDVDPLPSAASELLPAPGRMLAVTGLDSVAIDAADGSTTVVQPHEDDPRWPVGVVGATAIFRTDDAVLARDVATGRLLWSTPVPQLGMPRLRTEVLASAGAVTVVATDLEVGTVSTRSVDLATGSLGPWVLRAELAPIPGAAEDLLMPTGWSQYASLPPVGGRVTIAPGPWVANLALSGPVDTWTWPSR